MKLQGQVNVPATQEQVWQLFLDPTQLGKVIPGCEQVRQLDETHYEAVLSVKVQFMTVRSRAKGAIVTAEAPRLLVGELIGETLAMAGAFRACATLEFEPAADNALMTEIRYQMDLTMLGRLASLGEAMVRTTSQKLSKQFAENVSQLFASTDPSS